MADSETMTVKYIPSPNYSCADCAQNLKSCTTFACQYSSSSLPSLSFAESDSFLARYCHKSPFFEAEYRRKENVKQTVVWNDKIEESQHNAIEADSLNEASFSAILRNISMRKLGVK